MRGRQQPQGRRAAARRARGIWTRRDATCYRMRQKLVAFGDDFWIEDVNGRRASRSTVKRCRARHALLRGYARA